MRTILASLLTASLAVLVATPALAANGPVFSQVERQVILAYYQHLGTADDGPRREHHGHQHANHGHGHSRGLPPGIAKNLQRGKPLPPGIAMHRLPAALVAKLPPPPRGCKRVVVDGRVLLVDIATRMIHDVLADAIIHH